MVDDLIKDFKELIEYKRLYLSQKKDKEAMSKMIYELMLQIYESTPLEIRIKKFKEDSCSDCRHNFCNCEIPVDVLKPIPSEKEWIPSKKSCGNFEWS